jgi:hypothetical protein
VALFASLEALGAERRKIRWVASVYIDSQGVRLRHPESVACGKDYFVVADTGNSRLLRYAYRNEIATAEAEFPLPQSSPVMVQVNSKGDLYFLDSREPRIEVVNAAGEKLGELSLSGLPSKKRLIPRSFRIDRNDNIYILDIFSERVLVLDPNGAYSRHLELPEEYGFFSDLTVDAQGTILLLDSVDATVYSAGPDELGDGRSGNPLSGRPVRERPRGGRPRRFLFGSGTRDGMDREPSVLPLSDLHRPGRNPVDCRPQQQSRSALQLDRGLTVESRSSVRRDAEPAVV